MRSLIRGMDGGFSKQVRLHGQPLIGSSRRSEPCVLSPCVAGIWPYLDRPPGVRQADA